MQYTIVKPIDSKKSLLWKGSSSTKVFFFLSHSPKRAENSWHFQRDLAATRLECVGWNSDCALPPSAENHSENHRRDLPVDGYFTEDRLGSARMQSGAQNPFSIDWTYEMETGFGYHLTYLGLCDKLKYHYLRIS
ncbi:hypothetical protein Y032_0352g3267 [Ancylostoma ceylanicum]|uniref:Uncharacterized protein n=1 Tax=Ancylostoma ceylanicum TaxID=53326 RepID=A0A016RWH9_9BILA|nr:hypothetical protein Y032_0352g3267 [Ancylostoma ceylanicum]